MSIYYSKFARALVCCVLLNASKKSNGWLESRGNVEEFRKTHLFPQFLWREAMWPRPPMDFERGILSSITPLPTQTKGGTYGIVGWSQRGNIRVKSEIDRDESKEEFKDKYLNRRLINELHGEFRHQTQGGLIDPRLSNQFCVIEGTLTRSRWRWGESQVF